MSRSHLILAVIAGLTCAVFAVRVAIAPPLGQPADLSGLERAASAGEIQGFTDTGTLSVWANDFHRIEPALRDAAGDGEIRLMMGGTFVGTYSRRAGIQIKESP